MQVRIALVALVVGCGGKTVSVASSTPDETAQATPAPVRAPAPVKNPPMTPSCDTTLVVDVMPILVRSSCAASVCHGGVAPPNVPRIDPSDPDFTRAELVGFELSNGARYVEPGSPADSSILCNVARSSACGVHMPIGAQLSVADIATIEEWVACGARVR